MNRHDRRAARSRQRCPLPGLPFDPAAVVVLSNDGRTLEQAMAPGSVAVLMPVHRGDLSAAEPTPMTQAVIDADGAVVFAFEAVADAHQFQRLMDAARPCPPPPRPTHAAPSAVQ